MLLALKKINIYNLVIIFILVFAIDPLLSISGYIYNTNYSRNINYYTIFLVIVYYFIKILSYYYEVEKIQINNPVNMVLISIFIIFFMSYLVDDKSQYLYIVNDKNIELITLGKYYMKFLISTMSFFIIYLVVGENLVDIINTLLMKNYIINIIFLIYFINIAAFIISMKQLNTFSVSANIFTDHNSIYLYIGDIFALYSIIIVCFTKKYLTKIFFSLNSLFWLYKIGSRTSLYIYIIILSFIIVKYLVKNINIKGVMLLCFTLVVILTLFWCSYNKMLNINVNLNDRMTSILTNISDDGSFNDRKLLLNDGVNDISKHWFTGNMFAEIKSQGVTGGYIHNVLSYWQQFGIIPFLSIVLLIIYFLCSDFKLYLMLRSSIVVEITFCLSTFIFLSVILSRSYVNPYIWLALSSSYSLHHENRKLSTNIIEIQF